MYSAAVRRLAVIRKVIAGLSPMASADKQRRWQNDLNAWTHIVREFESAYVLKAVDLDAEEVSAEAEREDA